MRANEVSHRWNARHRIYQKVRLKTAGGRKTIMKKEISTTIGQRLTQLRKNSNRTQETLAHDLQEFEIPIGPSDISKIEHDAKLPSTETLCRLCQIFGVSADYILFGLETMAPPPAMSAKLENAILALAAEIQAFRGGME